MHEHTHKWTWALGESGSTERHCTCGDEDWYAPAPDLMFSLQQLNQGKLEAQQQLAEARALLERYQKLITRNRDDWQDAAALYALTDDDANMRLYQDIRDFLQGVHRDVQP